RARLTSALRWQALSPALVQLLRGNPVGKPIYQLLHPEDVPALDKAIAQAQTEAAVQHTLCRFLVADQVGQKKKTGGSVRSDTKLLPELSPGSIVTVRLDIKARRSDTGELIQYSCRFLDLTPIVLQKELELQVAQKTVSRAKRRLRYLGQDLDRLKLSYR